jgi:hypothetical protein
MYFIKNVALYAQAQQGTPTRIDNIQNVYKLFSEDEEVKKVTDLIRSKHEDGIKNGFKTINKTPYQKDKQRLLQSVVFSGDIDRSNKDYYTHSGRISVDIDENTKEDLTIFRRLIKDNRIQCIEALGSSISGHISSALWSTILVDIPEAIQSDYKAKEALHKRYFEYIKQLFNSIVLVSEEDKTKYQDKYIICLPISFFLMYDITSGYELNIIAGTGDLKRTRYITHDADLIVRAAKAIELTDLEEAEARNKTTNKLNKIIGSLSNIEASDLFDACHKFAIEKGFSYTPGQKKNYLSRFSIAGVLFGIPEEEIRSYILKNIHPDEDGDFITYPYKKYIDSYGSQQHKVKIKQNSFLPMNVAAKPFLTFDEHFSKSYKFNDLLNETNKTKRSLLIVPTGSGKSYASLKHIRPYYKKLYPGKVFVMVTPLNAITKQLAKEADDMQIICEGETTHFHAGFEDSICTAASFINWSQRLKQEDRLKDIILIFDEAHELITGAAYQKFDSFEPIFDDVFKVIGLSATPLSPLINYLKFKPFVCVRLNNPKVNIEYTRTTKKELIHSVLNRVNKHVKYKTLYFYNDKTVIELLAKTAQKQGLKADFIHAKNKHTDKALIYNSIVNDNIIPEELDHLFSTKLLAYGTSITNVQNIVFITKNNDKDFLEFIQAIARSRAAEINVSCFIVEAEVPGTSQVNKYDFDYKTIGKKIDKYRLQATAYNEDKLNLIKDGDTNGVKKHYTLLENLPDDYRRYIKLSAVTGLYIVDVLNLFADQYKGITQSTTADNFIRFMSTIPNATITENKADIITSPEDLDAAEVIGKEMQDLKDADISLIKGLFITDKNALFNHIRKTTEDRSFKRKLSKHVTPTLQKLDEDDLLAINRRIGSVERFIKRYIYLKSSFERSDSFNDTTILDIIFLGNRKYGLRAKQLRSHYNIILIKNEDKGLIKDTANRQATGRHTQKVTRAHLKLIKFAEAIQGVKVELSDVLKRAEQEPFFDTLGLNSRTFTDELKMFFACNIKKTNALRYITINNKLAWSDLISDDIELLYTKEGKFNVVT